VSSEATCSDAIGADPVTGGGKLLRRSHGLSSERPRKFRSRRFADEDSLVRLATEAAAPSDLDNGRLKV
jgi:hypothetical protein